MTSPSLALTKGGWSIPLHHGMGEHPVTSTGSLFWGPRLRLTAPRPDDRRRHLSPRSRHRYRAAPRPGSDGGRPRFEFRLRRRSYDLLIGFAALFALEWGNRTGKLAVGIGDPRHRRRGYGEESLTLLLNYAFRELNLDRVGLDVIEYNTPALRLYERLGFQHEGRSREAIWRDGAHYDLMHMGLLAREWPVGSAKAPA